MGLILSQAVALLVVASLVAILARRLALPYNVGLVLAGIALSFSGLGSRAPLTHDLIFLVILPPLLFEAALGIPWREFRRDAFPVLVLAILGTVLSAATVAAGMVLCLGWAFRPALIFGVLIAATDPVAVIGLFKSIKVPERSRLIVETESLFNDGVAAVLFGLVLAWDGSAAPSVFSISRDLAVTAGGGIIVGAACAVAAVALAGRTADHLVETVLTAAAAYGSFLLAEDLQVSGVLATVTAGLVIGRPDLQWLRRTGLVSSAIISPGGRAFLKPFWEFAAFVANSMIFLLIGLAVPADRLIGRGSAVAIGLVLAARALVVYGTGLAFSLTRWRISSSAQHILWWGGLRGALGLALALSLPSELASRDQIILMTFSVVIFSIVVQGLSMPLLLRRLEAGSET